MKKSFAAITASVLLTSAIIISCSTPAERVVNAQNNVTEANKNLEKANGEYLADIKNYRKETADKIAVNEKNLAEFKARIEHEKKDAKADYKKKIAELEQKNSDMKKKIDDYQVEGKEKWEIFKTEFSHSMDELGKSFKDITTSKPK